MPRPTEVITKQQTHVRLYLSLGLGVVAAAIIGLIYIFTGPK